MKKIIYVFIALFAVSSCKVIMKVPLPTDGLPDAIGINWGDSAWIQKELITKSELYNFSWLRKKASRKKYVDSINNLNDQALQLFKANKITATKFNTYAEASRGLCQLFYVFANVTDQIQVNGVQSAANSRQAAINGFVQKYGSNALIAKNRSRIMASGNGISLTGNDIFEQLAPQFIALLQTLLNDAQQ